MLKQWLLPNQGAYSEPEAGSVFIAGIHFTVGRNTDYDFKSALRVFLLLGSKYRHPIKGYLSLRLLPTVLLKLYVK